MSADRSPADLVRSALAVRAVVQDLVYEVVGVGPYSPHPPDYFAAARVAGVLRNTTLDEVKRIGFLAIESGISVAAVARATDLTDTTWHRYLREAARD